MARSSPLQWNRTGAYKDVGEKVEGQPSWARPVLLATAGIHGRSADVCGLLLSPAGPSTYDVDRRVPSLAQGGEESDRTIV